MGYRKNRVRDPGFEGTAARWSASMADLILLPGTSPAGGSRVARITQSALGVHGGEGREVRRNLVPNPSFEVNTAGWTRFAGTVSRVASGGAVGPAAMRCAHDAFSSGASATGIPAAPGATYTLSAYVRGESAAVQPGYLELLQSADGVSYHGGVGDGVEFISFGTDWGRFSVTVTTAADTRFLGVAVIGGQPTDIYVDAVMVEQSAALGDYFDGSTPAPPGLHNEWEAGTAGASPSIQRLNEAALTYTDDDAKTYLASRDETHAFSAHVRAGSVARQARARVRWLNAHTGNEMLRVTSGPVATVPGAWVRVSVAYPAPGFETALLDVVVEGMPLGESHDVDGALYERAPGPLPYFDGDTPSDPLADYGGGRRLGAGVRHAWLTQQGSRPPPDAQSVQVGVEGFDLLAITMAARQDGWAPVMDGVAANYFE